jgi:tRNA modification GTPase
MTYLNDDTVCALATAPGGAIAVVRVSGKEALAITDRIFRGRTRLKEAAPRTVHFGHIIEKVGEETHLIDEVLVSVFRAPHSYTGEDSCEISCHASRYIIGEILRLLIENGCRQAERGEFTQRAFLNGKMDLSQAEAVADLIAAENRSGHDIALGQLRGNFSTKLQELRGELLKLTSLLELELDFSDHEELEFADRTELRALTATIEEHIARLAHSFKVGQAIKQGVNVAIVGKTNVGKSTLLNQLLHEERAIVSDIHGTTRDVIEDCITLQGVTFRFIDTAGIRRTEDTVERLGIERTFRKMEEARIVLWVVDAPVTSEEVQEMCGRCKGKSLILVINKIDERPTEVPDVALKTICISAKEGLHLSELESAIVSAADIPEIQANDVIVTSTRHYESLLRAQQDLSLVSQSMDAGLSGELIAEDLKLVLQDLAQITGEGIITDSEVLANIFEHFCIGK